VRTFGVRAARTVECVAPDQRRSTGRRGEAVAAELLRRRGYRLLERNFRAREGEIDLIAARGETLVFCEVKALVARPGGPSSGPATPLEAVGRAKQAQVRRVARVWLAAQARLRARHVRFDVIGVTLSTAGELLRVEHIEGAF
jgi:putative endonuclease